MGDKKEGVQGSKFDGMIWLGEASDHPKNKKHLSISEDSMNDGRVSTEELSKAITEFAKHTPPITEQDIVLVKMNPSLSFSQKALITRKMKRIMRKRVEAK